MPTYLNCYTLVEQVRDKLNEYSTAYVQGTDISGKYQNFQVLSGINSAQRFIYSILLTRIPYEFLEEASLTGVDSVFTLPPDFGRLRYFKDENGRQVFPITPQKLKLTASVGSDRRYYRKGNTLVLEKTGISKTYTLYYERKCRELDFGKASAGEATGITLATTFAKKIADYYNGMTIENITQDWVDTIDDYTAGRVATISETAAANDYYGIVSDLPEPFHHLIIPRAVYDITGNYPVTQEKPNKTATQGFFDNLQRTVLAYAGQDQDVDIEDLFLDFDATYQTMGIISNE